jgi:hypothetical protein
MPLDGRVTLFTDVPGFVVTGFACVARVYAETHVFAAGFGSLDLGFWSGVGDLFELIVFSEGDEVALIADHWLEDLVLVLSNNILITFLKIVGNLHSVVLGTFLAFSL